MKSRYAFLKDMTALLLATSLVISGCGQGAEPVASPEEQAAQPEEQAEAVAKNTIDYRDPSYSVEDRVAALLSQMTLEEKAGQMVQAEQSNITAEEVAEYGIGSVLSGGGNAPGSGNNIENWQERVNELKSAAVSTRLGIPLIYGVDSVHGNNNVYGATVFPHNIGLGAANDPELMKEIGGVVAEETRAAGVQWTFAPCVGNPQDVTWGRSYECFSEKTEDISNLVPAYIEGLQGISSDSDEIIDGSHIVACAKHFIGEGYTTNGVNQGNVDMTPEEFDELLQMGVLDPYAKAINANVLTIMPSYNSVNGVKCHENKHLLTEVLKEQLDFKGVLIGDYNAIEQVSGKNYDEQLANCINAGLDMCMEPSSWKECRNTLIKLANNGDIPMERIDDAVTRILRVKFTAGMFEEEIGGALEQSFIDSFGSEEHREVARRAVRESLVLLKNDTVNGDTAINQLKNAKNIAVAGQSAYDIGAQCGGWTISWQGQTGKITKGTTIIEGFAKAVGEDVKLSHSVDGTVKKGADAVVVVVGEVPYAEMYGDCEYKDLKITSKDAQMLEDLKPNLPKGAPVIGIIVAGRPVDLSEYGDMFDAIVMAWLPGTEGDGVADVLFGDYDFTGKLTFTWMKDMNDIPSLKDASEDMILYPYGYGLTK